MSTTPHNRTIVDQHNRQAEGYARLADSLGRDRRNPDRGALLRRRIGAGPDDSVLDVACGPGRLSLDLAPHVRSVTGLDLTPGMLDQARAALAASGLGNVDFVHGDALAMPFADGSFSIVVSSAAFHHFEAPARVLAEMVRVCRPGGRVVISDVTPEAGKTGEYDRMERLRDPSHGHAHSLEELIALGAAAGLGMPEAHTGLSGPMPYAAVLAASFPEALTRADLLDLMRADAAEGQDRLGFKAELRDGEVLVSYPMSQVAWARP
ncbi:MAG: methyltransferase domain-containing protein [Novosphingobium sp.]